MSVVQNTSGGKLSMIHASAVVIGEAAVVIRGRPGAGKSTLCMHLIDAGSGKGLFARLIGDDRVAIVTTGGRAIVRPHNAIAGQIERRWEGIVALPFEPAAVVGCLVDLVDDNDAGGNLPRLPEMGDTCSALGETTIRRLRLPAKLPPGTLALRILAFLAAAGDDEMNKSPN